MRLGERYGEIGVEVVELYSDDVIQAVTFAYLIY